MQNRTGFPFPEKELEELMEIKAINYSITMCQKAADNRIVYLENILCVKCFVC